MMRFGTLLAFEAKKLFRKKLIWAVLAALVGLGLVTGYLNNVSSSTYIGDIEITGLELRELRKTSDQALAGRPIDQALIDEMLQMKAAAEEAPIPTTREEAMARLEVELAPSDLYTWAARFVSTDFTLPEDLTQEQLYAALEQYQRENWAGCGLTAGETAWWQEQQRQTQAPIVFEDGSFWEDLTNLVNSVNVVGILALAICLPGVFSDEHSRRTDQLNLAAPHGRRLFWVKLTLGLAFGLLVFLVYFVSGLIPMLLRGGTGGFGADIRLTISTHAMDLSIGQAALILVGLMVLSALLCSLFAMAAAEILRSGIAATALMVALVLGADMVPIPYGVRWLEEAVSYLPSKLVTIWEAFDLRLFPWFGTYLLPWQAAPLLWLVAGGLLTAWACRTYRRYQVTGR